MQKERACRALCRRAVEKEILAALCAPDGILIPHATEHGDFLFRGAPGQRKAYREVRQITIEAIEEFSHIDSVGEFDFSCEGNFLYASFRVNTPFGEIEQEVEIEI